MKAAVWLGLKIYASVRFPFLSQTRHVVIAVVGRYLRNGSARIYGPNTYNRHPSARLTGKTGR